VLLGASRAVAFASFIIAQAGQFVAPADAIAVTRFGGRLDGDERHCGGIVRFLRAPCKRYGALLTVFRSGGLPYKAIHYWRESLGRMRSCLLYVRLEFPEGGQPCFQVQESGR